jgi:hypothetical protein
VSEPRLVQTNGMDDEEIPMPVKRAFLEFCACADQYDFEVLLIVGFNIANARAARASKSAFALASMMSPRASSNPDRAEIFEDVAELFRKAAERSRQ